MAKPPQDPGSGPRIRARARGGSSSIRPEVVDALGGVERSLSEVAKWEQMLAGRSDGGPVVPALPEGYVGLSNEVLSPPAPEAEPQPEEAAPEEVPDVREIGLLDAVREAEEGTDEAPDDEPQDAAAAADALVAPLLVEFKPDEPADPEGDGDGSVLWAARTVETPAAETELLIARRRRQARILSWAGALVLIAGAALWLVPDRSNDDDGDQELPAVDVTDTTRSQRQILDQTGTTETTATTEPPTTTTPTTTATTRRTTATTARSTPTTQGTTPTTQAPAPTLPLPGPPGTVNPSRTVPTSPTTPTTQPSPTTTANTDGNTDGPTTG